MQKGSPFIAAVERSLEQILETPGPDAPAQLVSLVEAGRHLCLAEGAKRMRPLLVKSFGQMVGLSDDTLIPIATAAEMIHAASLLHDDIVDDSDQRRGQPTVNALWSNTRAVLAGDFVLSRGLRQLSGLPPEVMATAVELVDVMVQGVMLEVSLRGNLDATRDQWFDIARAKTGELFAWCGGAAATTAGNEAAYRDFTAMGMELGLAFQVADDIKDLAASDDGKPRFADIRQRNTNLVIIMALENDRALRRQLEALWSQPTLPETDIAACGFRVLESQAMSAAYTILQANIQKAQNILLTYKNVPGSDIIALWINMLSQHFQKDAAS